MKKKKKKQQLENGLWSIADNIESSIIPPPLPPLACGISHFKGKWYTIRVIQAQWKAEEGTKKQAKYSGKLEVYRLFAAI